MIGRLPKVLITHFCMFTFINLYANRPPGVNTSFGNEFNRLNTWYSHLDLSRIILNDLIICYSRA